MAGDPEKNKKPWEGRLTELGTHGYKYIEYGEEGRHDGRSDQMMRVRMTGAVIGFFKRRL